MSGSKGAIAPVGSEGKALGLGRRGRNAPAWVLRGTVALERVSQRAEPAGRVGSNGRASASPSQAEQPVRDAVDGYPVHGLRVL